MIRIVPPHYRSARTWGQRAEGGDDGKQRQAGGVCRARRGHRSSCCQKMEKQMLTFLFLLFFMFRIESVVRLNLLLGSPTKTSSKCHKLILPGKSSSTVMPTNANRASSRTGPHESPGAANLLVSLASRGLLSRTSRVWTAFYRDYLR